MVVFARDGLELVAVEQMSGYPVYRVVKRGGVAGHCKNLIFAANGPNCGHLALFRSPV
jgi:hypothetical protein